MSPQPLSKLHSAADVIIGPMSVETRPGLALQIARAINVWSEVESRLSNLLTVALGANAAPATAMYVALTSSTAQVAALKAAVHEVLSGDDCVLFDAVMSRMSIVADARHRFAHWLWGWSPQLPDALLLTDARYVLKYRAERKSIAEGKPLPDFDKKKVYVYREPDFISIISEMMKVNNYIHQFGFIVGPPIKYFSARTRQDLSQEPALRPYIDRIKARVRER